jgi:hypothetical protein
MWHVVQFVMTLNVELPDYIYLLIIWSMKKLCRNY